MLSSESCEQYYKEVCFQEILRFRDLFYPLLIDLQSNASSDLYEIKKRCSGYPVRTIIAKEFTPATFEALQQRRFPLLVINLICRLAGYSKDDIMEPLCITDWQTEKFSEMIGEDLSGYPAFAGEYVDSKGITVHRDDVDFKALSPLEKITFRKNTFTFDEILSSDPKKTPTLEGIDLTELIGLNQFFFIDEKGSPYIYIFFYVRMGGHMLEFGLRMNVPEEHVVAVADWMSERNLQINFTTTEISHDEY